LTAALVDLGIASACSANTVLLLAGSCDVPAVVDAFDRFTALLPTRIGDEVRRNASRGLAQAFRQIGASLAEADAMSRAFGNQIGLALQLEKGAVSKPELLLRLGVRDAAKVTTLLQRLEAASMREDNVEWKTRKAGAHEIRFCSVPMPEIQLQLSPCYALANGALWIASDVMGLLRALQQNGEQSLAAQADFVDVQKLAAGASGIMHLRLDRAVAIGWPFVESFVYPQLDAHRDQFGIDSESLPDEEALAKALGNSTFVWRVDDDTVRLSSHGTLSFGGLFAGLSLLGDNVLSRAAAKVF
jgi:hypothetical protein